MENDGQQVAGVPFQHPLLIALNVVIPVLHAGVIAVTQPADLLAEQDDLRDTADGRQHIAGRPDDIIHAGELERPEVVLLALAVDGDAVHHATGHVDDLEPFQ